MNAETIQSLKSISVPKTFKKDEYVCYEGQPGSEMYIILKGTIGVYITSALGNLTEVAQIKEGNFFGEMAIFDNEPRSASCIALEDTVCVAVNKDNLHLFLANCSEMAKKMLENMSSRIRKLNNDLYKSTQSSKIHTVEPFAIPSDYKFSHVVKEPFQDDLYYEDYACECPICKKEITLKGIRKNVMEIHKMELDGRVKYLRCDPIWYEVQKCPNCRYSNHYLNFFKINSNEYENIAKLLQEEHTPYIKKHLDIFKTKFDALVLKYLQAIHINEKTNPEDHALIGTLWLNLYWLGVDSGDDKLTLYSAINGTEKLITAVNEQQALDEITRATLALSLANLLIYTGRKGEAMKYCLMGINSKDERVKANATLLREKLI